MILRKLREMKMRMLRQKRAPSAAIPQPREENIVQAPIESNEKPIVSGVQYLRERLNVTKKQYFDSADHFLQIYKEEREITKEITQKEILQKASSILSATPANTFTGSLPPDAAISPAPLETAYSEMVEEAKPKKSV